MTDPGNLISTADAALMLGVSTARVRQLVDEGKLRKPLDFGARANLHDRASIEIYKDLAQGEDVTGIAAVAVTATNPLMRVLDSVVTVPGEITDAAGNVVWQTGSGQPLPLHVRHWRGLVDDRLRHVCVLSTPDDCVDLTANSQIRPIAAWISRAFLDDAGPNTIWITVHPSSPFDGRPLIQNLVLGTSTDNAPQPRWWWDRVITPYRHDTEPIKDGWNPTTSRWLRMADIRDIDRLVGAAVEFYPAGCYTREVIEQWQREDGPVDLTVDPHNLRVVADALSVLARYRRSEPVAGQACAVLAQLLAWRRASEGLRAPDSWMETERTRPEYDAAHLAVRPHIEDLSSYDADVLGADYGDMDYTLTPSAYAGLCAWSDTVDEFGDSPNPALAQALDVARQEVKRRAVEYLSNTDAASTSLIYPPTTIRTVPANSPVAEQYWSQCTTGVVPSRDVRRLHRELAAYDREDDEKWATDVDGRPVVRVCPYARISNEVLVTVWPLVPPPSIPAGCSFVGSDTANSYGGDMPVFIRHPDGILHPLPRDPERVWAGWSWGYSGGGPAHLEVAILRTLRIVDELSSEQIAAIRPYIADQLRHAPEHRLDISIDAIRARLPRKPARRIAPQLQLVADEQGAGHHAPSADG